MFMENFIVPCRMSVRIWKSLRVPGHPPISYIRMSIEKSIYVQHKCQEKWFMVEKFKHVCVWSWIKRSIYKKINNRSWTYRNVFIFYRWHFNISYIKKKIDPPLVSIYSYNKILKNSPNYRLFFINVKNFFRELNC